MRRKIVMFVLIILFYLLQVTVFKALAFAFVSPNLMIILVTSIGLMRGRKDGLVTGFFGGLIIDLFFSGFIGTNALFYMTIGYLNGFFSKQFFKDDIKLPMALILGSDFLFNLFVYISFFLLRGRYQFGYYMLNLIIPELIYTLVVSIPLYYILLKINNKLEAVEKKGAVKFGQIKEDI